MEQINITFSRNLLYNSTVEDFYPALIENNLARISSWIFSVLNILFAPPLLVFIIWFEKFGSDQRRTLINMLVSMICFTFCIYLLAAHTIEVVRFGQGPLPNGLCCFQNWIKTMLFYSLLMFLDAIAITRYVYIFVLKNPASFNDTFWCCFLTLWIYTCSIIVMTVVHILTGCHTMGFFICNGQVTDKLEKLLSDVVAVIVVVSFVLHMVIHLNIWYFKYKGTVHPDSNPLANKPLYLKDLQTSALTNFTSYVSTIVVFFAMIGCIHHLDNIDMRDLNSFPNYICAYYINLLAPCLAVDILIGTFFSHKRVRRSFHEELLVKLEN